MAGMAVGGPVGGPNMMNNSSSDPTYHARQLNTYIYDYFLKNGHYDLARMVNTLLPTTNADTKPSPRRDINGVNDNMDEDSKDNLNKIPEDLPRPKLPATGNDNSFLLDWWSQFWDVFSAQRNRIKGPAQAYIQHSHVSKPDMCYDLRLMRYPQNKHRYQQQQQQQLLRQMDPQMMGASMQGMKMMQNPMMSNELRQRAFANANQRNAGQNLSQMQNMKQQQMLQQSGQMQREGSTVGMGQDRPQSPGGSAENAPSPKRQRMETNGFNGPMGPAGRGQPQGMQGQGMPNVAGLTPGASMNGQQNPDLTEYYGRNQMHPTLSGPPGHTTGNHALQDYQMQLMLLEQQNKKRLLMARQEQDNSQSIAHGPGPGGPGQGMQQNFPPGVSPQSRPGPSPNPNDQVKRGTEKMGQSPLPDGTMPQQGSPAANFDPSQIPQGMPQHYFNHLKAQQEGMQIAPNGQMLRPPSSNPNFAAQASPEQQMQQMQQLQARQRQVNMQNGMGFPGAGPPNMMPQPQQGQPGQQGPNAGTTQQRAAMGPPPTPAAGTQPSSPAQSTNQPPTPSQTNKPNPKKKNATKDNNKKAASKKGGAAAGATPATESQDPPANTPSTPITPMHGSSFSQQQQKNGTGPQPQPSANASQPPPAAPAPQPPPIDANAGAPFGDISSADLNNLNLDFAPLGDADVLDNFDFDSFLQPESADGPMFNLDQSFSFPNPELEAATGE
ncbi:MAG: hypothetical protein Q9165_003695 [Trypethelium subeluteriae]